MTYLVDTDWAADYLADRRDAVPFLDDLAEGGLAISIVTYGEIYEGILFGRDPKQQEAGFRRFLRGVDLLPLNRTIMRRFAFLRGTLRQQGQIIGDRTFSSPPRPSSMTSSSSVEIDAISSEFPVSDCIRSDDGLCRTFFGPVAELPSGVPRGLKSLYSQL